jgi:hypothetical protein
MKTFRKSFLFFVAFLSLYFWYNQKYATELLQEKKLCGRYPKEEDILMDNVVWQVAPTAAGFVYLLNAFLDTRWNCTVRVLLNAPKDMKQTKLFCQFWRENDKTQPVVVEANTFFSIFPWSKFS